MKLDFCWAQYLRTNSLQSHCFRHWDQLGLKLGRAHIKAAEHLAGEAFPMPVSLSKSRVLWCSGAFSVAYSQLRLWYSVYGILARNCCQKQNPKRLLTVHNISFLPDGRFDWLHGEWPRLPVQRFFSKTCVDRNGPSTAVSRSSLFGEIEK